MASNEKKQPEIQKDSFKAEFARRFKTSPFIFIGTIVILIIVIVAFVFVPAIVPEAQGAGDLTFGYYNKVPISYVQGNYFYQVQQALARQQQSDVSNSNYLDLLSRIWRGAFERAVVRQGILDEMKSSGYVAPEDVVDRQVALLPDFQENGVFSAIKYRQMDKAAQLNLWRQIQEGIAMEHYIEDMTEIIVSSQEGAFIRSMASPRRSFEFVSMPISAYPDSEIASYVGSSPALFRVTHLSRITVSSSEREARQILDAITSETVTFEDAAKDSKDSYAEKGGDMGSKMAYELVSEIPDTADGADGADLAGAAAREAVIGLSKGELSGIIKVPGGWAFFRAEEDPRAADTSDPAQMEKIRGYVQGFERGRMDDWLLAEAEKLVAEAKEKGFDAAINERKLEKRSFGPLPLNYGDHILFPAVRSSGIPELLYAGENEQFWQAAFSTPLRTLSKPVIAGDYALVLYPLEESEADENETGFIEVYYSSVISGTIESRLSSYFLNNGKLEDRFSEVFIRQVLGYK